MKQLLLTVWQTVDDRLGLVKNIQPILDHRVPRESKWAYVFGSATLFAFLLQVVTGVCTCHHLRPPPLPVPITRSNTSAAPPRSVTSYEAFTTSALRP